MFVPKTAPHLALLCVVFAACTPPVWARDPAMRPFQAMQPVSDHALAGIRAKGRQYSGTPPRGDVAVILWDEPKTPRPSGGKSSVVSVALHRDRPPLQSP